MGALLELVGQALWGRPTRGLAKVMCCARLVAATITNGADKNFTVVGQYATIRRRLFFSTQTVWFGLCLGGRQEFGSSFSDRSVCLDDNRPEIVRARLGLLTRLLSLA